MDAHVGRRPVDVGALAERVAEAVAHGVLDLQRREFEALQRALLRSDVDPYFSLDRKEFLPGNRTAKCVDIVLVPVLELADAPQDARGDARFEVDPIAGLPGSREGYASGYAAGITASQRDDFLEKQLFQAARSAGEERFRMA